MSGKTIARVILLPNGEIHIVARQAYTVSASVSSLLSFFADPIFFIREGCEKYPNTITTANRKKVPVPDVPGLTLASCNSDRQINLIFSELFQFFLTADSPEDRIKPLNLYSYLGVHELLDEKAFLLRFYLDFCNQKKQDLKILGNLKLQEEVQYEIIKEILTAFFDTELPKAAPLEGLSDKIKHAEQLTYSKAQISSPADATRKVVSASEYADKNGLSVEAVRVAFNTGELEGFKKNHRIYIFEDAVYKKIDMRTSRKLKKVNMPVLLPDSAPEEEKVMAEIKEFKYYTAEIGKYIRTLAELSYYTKNKYKQVIINNKNALIVDVKVEYVASDGKSNRELMQAGKAPRVAGSENLELWELHHIGQNHMSPLCPIRATDHNGKGLSNVFHPGPKDPELNRPEFDALKSTFWREYVKVFDAAGKNYAAIPTVISKFNKYK